MTAEPGSKFCSVLARAPGQFRWDGVPSQGGSLLGVVINPEPYSMLSDLSCHLCGNLHTSTSPVLPQAS